MLIMYCDEETMLYKEHCKKILHFHIFANILFDHLLKSHKVKQHVFLPSWLCKLLLLCLQDIGKTHKLCKF